MGVGQNYQRVGMRKLLLTAVVLLTVSFLVGCGDRKIKERIAALDTKTLIDLRDDRSPDSKAATLIAEELQRRDQSGVSVGTRGKTLKWYQKEDTWYACTAIMAVLGATLVVVYNEGRRMYAQWEVAQQMYYTPTPSTLSDSGCALARRVTMWRPSLAVLVTGLVLSVLGCCGFLLVGWLFSES